MKKFFILFLSLVLIFFLLTLYFINIKKEGKDFNLPDFTNLKHENVNSYYPIAENSRYIYKISGGDSDTSEITIDYITDDKIQQRIKNGDSINISVIEIKDKKVNKILTQGEEFYRENLINTLNSNASGEILLMEPLKTGTEWTLTDNRIRKITNDKAEVSTPLGNFKAIEVTTESDGQKNYDYYALGVGLIKSVVKNEEKQTEITYILNKIEKNAYLTEKISFYYPDYKDMTIKIKIEKVDFYTNDITEKVLTESYKKATNYETNVFTRNTKINSFNIDSSGTLNIDLNKSFLKETNVESIREGMILQSITNTFCTFFGAKESTFTIDSEDYNSKHIVLYKQPIKVNLSGYTNFYDVIVYGGTPSGIMAAIAAAREGKDVTLLEPSKHIGGMVTGGLSYTDRGTISVIGGLAREFFEMIGEYYDKNISWTFEPHVAEEIFIKMIQEENIKVYYNTLLNEEDGVLKDGQKIISLKTKSNEIFRGRVFIDSSYEGDLMAMSEVSYTYGRESKKDYNESFAGILPPMGNHNFIYPFKAYDENGKLYEGISPVLPGKIGSGDKKIQSYNYRLCLTNNIKNQMAFEKPKNYDPHKYKILAAWLNNLKKNEYDRKLILADVIYLGRLPNDKFDMNNYGPLSTDYVGESYEYPDADYEKREEIRNKHKEYIQGMLYFLLTDESVPIELRIEISKYGYAKDEFVDNDSWPYQLYVREGRRMVGDFVMTQNDINSHVKINDTIGMGSYGIDSHNVQRYYTLDGFVQNEGDIQVNVKPYQIPYKIMMPKNSEAENLIVTVCVSASHVAYSSLRMEPQYMIMGEAAGVASSISIDNDCTVQDIDTKNLSTKLKNNKAILVLD